MIPNSNRMEDTGADYFPENQHGYLRNEAALYLSLYATFPGLISITSKIMISFKYNHLSHTPTVS